jgi:hypothetical protein
VGIHAQSTSAGNQLGSLILQSFEAPTIYQVTRVDDGVLRERMTQACAPVLGITSARSSSQK